MLEHKCFNRLSRISLGSIKPIHLQ